MRKGHTVFHVHTYPGGFVELAGLCPFWVRGGIGMDWWARWRDAVLFVLEEKLGRGRWSA